ncbi:MAG: efflux RND transporter permease subunit [Pseudomonadota bacterium]
MNAIIDFAVHHARTVLLGLLLILIAGAFSYVSIPKEADPDVEIPVIYTSLSHEGISPEDAERLLVRPVEQSLRAIEGIKKISSNAYQGGASVTLEFDAGVDTSLALQDVREKVDGVKAELPEETDEPIVSEVTLSRMDPMLVLQLSGAVQERVLTRLARDLKDDIEGLAGVLEVNTAGDREEVIEVLVDPRAMESYEISQSELFQLVDRNNRLVAAGTLQGERGRFPVKVPGVFETVEDVMAMPVKADGDRIVALQEIASIRRTYKDATSFARIDGRPSISLEIIKRAGANVIDTVDEVRALVERESALWPSAVKASFSRDKSRDIRNMLSDLENNVLSAVLLVFVVIIGILGLRSALLVGVAIPGSFLAAMLVLNLMDINVNIVVLFSLIMAVGMLVDGAIVVTELADRKMAEGLPRKDAYATAAKRMALPITASTLTTLAAFFPLLFWPDVTGQFMRYLPITLIAVLTASLVMALVFVPTLGGIFGRAGTLDPKAQAELAAAEQGDLDEIRGLTGAYLRVLRVALRVPLLAVTGVTALLVGIYIAYGTFGRGMEFFPDVEPEFSSVEVRARGDLSPQEQDALVRQVEARILDMPEFDSVYARTGASRDEGTSDIVGTIQLQFVDWSERRPAAQILEEIRERTADLAGIVVTARTPRAGPSNDKPIIIEVSSRYPERLEMVTTRVRQLLEEVPGLQDVSDSRPLPGIEWRLNVDRAEAARYGADVTLVGNAVQLVTNGLKIGEYRPDDADDEVEIRVRYPASSRSLTEIDSLRVPSDRGLVPIGNFVTRRPAQEVGTLERTDLRRTMSVKSDVRPGVQIPERVAVLREAVGELSFDRSVNVSFRGDSEEQESSQAFLLSAMLVAVAIIYIILVTQFNSLFQGFLILTAVLFSTGGVLLGHLLLQQPFGLVMSGIGVIALAGIVVNNNIVLIDTYNTLRAAGMEATEAILRTCAQRIRPVLLTTVTTVLGLLPMVFGINLDFFDREILIGGPSAQWWTQLSSAVAGGLAFATVLTLLLTPSMLMLQARVERWDWRAFLRRLRDAEIPEGSH